MRTALSAALVGSALVLSVASPAVAAPPPDLRSTCEGLYAQDRGTFSCTTTSTTTTLSDIVSASHEEPLSDGAWPLDGVRHTVGYSRTETVVETTTVQVQKGAGEVIETTSDRVVSSTLQPVECRGYVTVPTGPAFAFTPDDFAKCAALGLFVSPTVTPEPAPPATDTWPRCAGVRTVDRGLRTCTTTATSTVSGDIVKASAMGPYIGPYTWAFYTGTSRLVSVVETTTVTSRRGAGPATTTTSERVLSSAVEPLSCYAWTVSYRGGTGPDGLQELSDCAALGLFTA